MSIRTLILAGATAALAAAALPVSALAQPAPGPPEPPRGHLVVAGGGGMPERIFARAIALAGGPAAPVVVFPQASEEADTGDVVSEQWRKAGCAFVTPLASLADLAAVKRAVEGASLIWFTGGDQVKLLKAFEGTGLPELIARRYREGAVVGGKSAGAAVMSPLTLTGDADLQSITSGATKTVPGLGLWPGVIVDQHFLKRQRYNRLLSLVLEHPGLVGVGIDEDTAVLVSGRRFEVIGDSSVVVIDARRAAVDPRQSGARSAARDVTVHVLTEGMGMEIAAQTLGTGR